LVVDNTHSDKIKMGHVELVVPCWKGGRNSDSVVLVRRHVGLMVHWVEFTVVKDSTNGFAGRPATVSTIGNADYNGNFPRSGSSIL
jgi:hypothetical protein